MQAHTEAGVRFHIPVPAKEEFLIFVYLGYAHTVEHPSLCWALGTQHKNESQPGRRLRPCREDSFIRFTKTMCSWSLEESMIPRGWVGRFLKKLMGTILYYIISYNLIPLSKAEQVLVRQSRGWAFHAKGQHEQRPGSQNKQGTICSGDAGGGALGVS